jgi:DNA helicase-2/ATP-dependent DNA helicase PcrA
MQLNPQQLQAAQHIEGPVMVLAGPGTGKTQIIAARIAEILEQTQLSPHNILCLTFTESGVVAMRSRLMQNIGNAAYHVQIHTFHSFCNRVIKEHPEEFLFARELEPLTDLERVQLIHSCIDSLSAKSSLKPFAAPYFFERDIASALQSLKREAVGPEDLLSIVTELEGHFKKHKEELENFVTTHARKLSPEDYQNIFERIKDTPLASLSKGNPEGLEKKQLTAWKASLKKQVQKFEKNQSKQFQLVELFTHYQAQLKKKGRYDFEDMILFVKKAFQENKHLLALYQEQFQYILLDEYQDTNGAQNEIVRLLGSYFKAPNIFVVGDDKQSIYRFQGASLENILGFYKTYKDDLTLIPLVQNYRSQQSILDAAHQLIQNNLHGMHTSLPNLAKELKSQSKDTEPLRLVACPTHQSECHFILNEIKAALEAGTPPDEIVVLFRNNYDSQKLIEILDREKVPFHLHAKDNSLDDVEIQDWIHLLKVIDNPESDRNLFFLLHQRIFQHAPLAILKLTQAARKNKKSYIETMLGVSRELASDNLANPDVTSSTTPTSFTPLAQKILNWHQLCQQKPLIQAMESILKESTYLEQILASPDKLTRLSHFSRFFDEIKQLNQADHNITLTQALAHFELLREYKIPLQTAELPTKEKRVQLMTAHRSKGLEFEHVFILKCKDKHWGNKRARAKLELPAQILKNELTAAAHDPNEDERRLFYVALTRAKKHVTFTYAQHSDSGRPQLPSVFIEEIPAELKEEIELTESEESIEAQLLTNLGQNSDPLESSELSNSEEGQVSQEEKDFIRALLQNYKMSSTHLNNYLRCPRLFYYNNILRIPGARSKSQAFGTAVHESLRDLLESMQKATDSSSQDPSSPDPLTPNKQLLLERFEHHLKRQILSKEEYKGGLEYGQHHLSIYFEANESRLAGKVTTQNTLLEYDFSAHGVNVDGVPLTGKLDKIDLNLELKQAHVVDYKTGNPDSKSKALGAEGEYRRQIAFYKLLCDNSPLFPYKMHSGEIDFVQASPKDGTHKRHLMEISEEELTKLKTQIKDVYNDIMSLRFLTVDDFETCGECEYCELKK